MRLLVRCILALSVVVLGFTSITGDVPTVRANLEHCDNPVPLFTEFGGGSGFSGWCPPEYSTCEDSDGDGCIDIGGGGGGGGWIPPADCGSPRGVGTYGDYQVLDYGQCASVIECAAERNARNANQPPTGDARFDCWERPDAPESSGRWLVFWRTLSCGGSGETSQVRGWTVVDGGDCRSIQRCNYKRDVLNVELPAQSPLRAYCWQSPRAPETTGTHIVLAGRSAPPTTTTTTSTTTAPPATIRPPRGGGEEPPIEWVS